MNEQTLRIGSSGEPVRALQRALGIAADGAYGPATAAAVRMFQQRAGLAVDGVAGPATLAALRTQQRGRLTPDDIAATARALDVDAAAVRAVIEIESRGSGFLADSRPVILFERHIMRRRLAATGRDADLLARYLPDIINSAPGGYHGGAAEHDRLYLARQIDPASAIESASWGLFQIMGFHWQALGYASALDFEARMAHAESDQLEAFARFIRANPALHAALKRRDWVAFAAGYNGPAYARNQYDTKLAAAYARHQEA